MVFAGYGLQVPEAKHDDLAGLDLKGKVVLLLTGGPSAIPGPLLAHYQNTRWTYLKQAGAIGVISIQNPKGQDIPWDRSKLARFLPSMAIADPALDETRGQQLAVTLNPATAEKFFEGTGHTFKEMLALSNAGKVLPRFRGAGVHSRDGRHRATRSSPTTSSACCPAPIRCSRTSTSSSRRISITSASASRSTGTRSTTARWTTRRASRR